MTSVVRIEADQDAIEVLNETWSSDDVGYTLPIDPVKIAKEYGIAVYENDLPTRISGAIVSTAERGPIILLNKNDAMRRRRFTCAHEIGHFIKRMSSDQADSPTYEFVDLRGTLASEGTNDEEIYANQFAASLLMPEPVIRALVVKGYSQAQLVDMCKVSRDVMLFRFQNLKL